ncbi:hypothetical protein NPIL_623871 [Nephila pilipes]|uniref:Uncharacterized protein n=1 Tax=Nephila pilipes TaxID=299642 RepID=A0A8X6PLP9_NEPPI|nr:hypothetical protein NPIL_623871 [Nephila pilipes]
MFLFTALNYFYEGAFGSTRKLSTEKSAARRVFSFHLSWLPVRLSTTLKEGGRGMSAGATSDRRLLPQDASEGRNPRKSCVSPLLVPLLPSGLASSGSKSFSYKMK